MMMNSEKNISNKYHISKKPAKNAGYFINLANLFKGPPFIPGDK